MDGMEGMDHGHGMGGMGMAHGDGLSASEDGYTLEPTSHPMPGMAMPLTFRITHGGTPVTGFETEQTKQLHLYLIRTDLTGFQHLHPTMAADGTWSVTPAPLQPGDYRLYTQLTPTGAHEPLVLSVPLAVGHAGHQQALPAAAPSTTVDGYTVTVDTAPRQHGDLRLSFTRDGAPVDLERYLDTYAHVTAFHEGDLAFTHLHPMSGGANGRGGSDLTFMTEFPETGRYRMFVQFRADGALHTAALTVAVA
jgi:hypothetical protein